MFPGIDNSWKATIKDLNKVGLQRSYKEFDVVSFYPPLSAMKPIEELPDPETLFNSIDQSDFKFYLHFPFCSLRCTFCHFYKEAKHNESNELLYIQAVQDELNYYTDRFGKINPLSIYFGGGSPSQISLRGLHSLLEILSGRLNMTREIMCKFELLVDDPELDVELPEKLRLLKNFGVNRLVLDIQSFNQDSLKAVGRPNASKKNYRRVIELCESLGFDQFTTAVMIGLPYDTPETVEQTLSELTSYASVAEIHTYPVVFLRFDSITKHFFRKKGSFMDPLVRDLLTRSCSQFLRQEGFVEGPIYFFNRKDLNNRPIESGPYSGHLRPYSENLLAIGPSSYGFIVSGGKRLVYMNAPDLHQYAQKLKAGSCPIWKGFYLSDHTMARRKMIMDLTRLKNISRSNLESQFGKGVLRDCEKYISAFCDLKLLEDDGDSIVATDIGRLRLEEMAFHLSEDFVKESLKQFPDYWTERHTYYPRVSEKSENVFKSYLANAIGI